MNNEQDTEFFNILADICYSNLKNSKECISYLKDRNFTDDSIDKFKIGYFPQNLSQVKKYIPETFLHKYNLVLKDGYCDFASRYYLIFPIHNEYGDVEALMGRTLLSEDNRKNIGISKYKNSSYKKSQNLYGLNVAKQNILKANNVYIVEGNFDVIKMHQSGIKNSIGICGTAFSRNHLIKIAKYTDRISFIMDNDDAGVKSAERICKLFEHKGINLRFLKLPSEYKDIDEYLNIKSKQDLKNDIKIISFSFY